MREGIELQNYVIVGFSQRDRLTNQLRNISFYRPQVSFAQCILGAEKYADAGMELK